ncbi:Gfo/Idh/MocA family oxidoreductase [Oceanispirochaeta sp.]|uniref:Gfo/Idh/MocA family protein n=1 Tax=Oceanispirochaeta sp. TaxID=2035350 RepID=UPI00263983A1|nr:Gfo/Idh/MocA family oxidoreductase [Oceanispirochaeta sp.]MDA3958199.1 Gfo/Idh/MocA family oxidoreductase [Oceanispirochaeta sp.]
MEKKRIKAGILGSGFAASFHTEALKRVYGVHVEIAGVYSPHPERCQNFGKERRIPVCTSEEELFSVCDVVHICTPPASHEALAVRGLNRGRHVIIEKPFTGYFGKGESGFSGDSFDRASGLIQAQASIQRILEAEKSSAGTIFYAENWVYAPAIQKEREVLEKTKGQILWIQGQEGHSGSHSPTYGDWSFSGGGSIMGKSVHPLTAALYLKSVEGRVKGIDIRPASVTARTHSLTRMNSYQDDGFLRSGYKDIEDFGALHVIFSDGSIADIFASEIILGGVHNHMEVNASNHRAVININPNTALQTFNPKGEQFDDIYVVEKIGTKEGWANTSPDEDWFTGYQNEMEHFYNNVVEGTAPESGSKLASDTIATVYSAYLSASHGGKEQTIPLL